MVSHSQDKETEREVRESAATMLRLLAGSEPDDRQIVSAAERLAAELADQEAMLREGEATAELLATLLAHHKPAYESPK